MSDSDQRNRETRYLEAESSQLKEIFDFATLLNQQVEFKEILRVVTSKAADLLHASMAVILMINPKTRQTVKTIHREAINLPEPRYRSIQHQVSGWVMRHNKSLISHDLPKDARFSNVDFAKVDVHSVIAVPLRIEGLIIGSIILMNDTSAPDFDESALEFLEILAVVAAPYLRNVQELKGYFEAALPVAALFAKYEQVGLVGRSEKFKDLLASVEAAAKCDIRVLLEGESGTGKELVARAIHMFSSRSEKPYLAIDCGAIPENLLESELFGHVRGAFTGANTDRKGLLEEADSGTLFMDEIANLPLPMQAKLMRVLQEGEIRRVGSNQAQAVDVRIIAASSSPLKHLVEAGTFRQDLYFRLHVYPVSIPSLNQRDGDISLLANHFLNKSVKQQGKKAQAFHAQILEYLNSKQWIGNIRELENLVERLVAIAADDAQVIDLKILPADIQEDMENRLHVEVATSKSLQEQLQKVEADILEKYLSACGWNQSKAARQLGLSEGNIRFRMEKLKIKRPQELD
ncbi:sigma 54-interacting transcriptional regulator [bacterium]|nr:sigma 54-interacting transcriptional regulator [bacterium]